MRKCDVCNKQYKADNRNLKRGWGLCCSKSCAAKKRERSKPGYDPETVRYNNLKRDGLLPRCNGFIEDDGIDYFIDNDGTIEELVEKVKVILVREKIL